MKSLFVAAAASLAIAVAGAVPAFASEADVASKTVTLESMFRQTGYPKPALALAKTVPAILQSAHSPLIVKYAREYGVPVDLAHAVVRVESNFNAKARGSSGEVGLMQIKPATARMLGYSGTVKGLFDPETNIRWGMKYLAMAHDLGGGQTCNTILKYNAGHAATRMNPVSKRYCGKVRNFLEG